MVKVSLVLLLPCMAVVDVSEALCSNTRIPTSRSMCTSTTSTSTDRAQQMNKLSSNLKKRRKGPEYGCSRQKLKFQACPEPELDLDMDRREATFALLGQLLAGGVGAATFLANPQPSEAIYGADANIALPNVVEGINNRVTQQCLVESLGNRECLVYLDPEKKIYKGADAQVLVERLEKATAALAEIPTLVSEKKWIKVTGVITGPMGSLGRTMDQLSKLSENEIQLSTLEKVIKNDLYAIAAAADKKNGEQILKFHEKATNDLISYAKALS